MSGNAGSDRGMPALIRIWFLVTAILPALIGAWVRLAHRRLGAAPDRIGERFGKTGLKRPLGKLVWIHAASVGEVASVARLGRAIQAGKPGCSLLITTATATGAATAARLLPEAIHQYLPIDTPAAVSSFLDHWHPDAALFVEADLWPRLVYALAEKGCPMALVNARHSRSRERFPKVYAALLSRMEVITVQDQNVLNGLVELGLEPSRLHMPGNLKADTVTPAINKDLARALMAAADGRGIWAAVSTHAGEEDIVLRVHAALPGSPLLVLVPRHPERSASIIALLQTQGVTFTRQSQGDLPGATTQVHLVDVLGETGSVFDAVKLVLLGGSLVPGIGGHTPFEPAAFECAILSGPHVANFAWAYPELVRAGGARLVQEPAALGREVAHLLEDDADRRAMQAAAKAFHTAQAGATDATLRLLAPVLPS